MTHEKILYHGNSRKLIGEKLTPNKPVDLGKEPNNLHEGIYATDIKDLAISMGIICGEGITSSSLNFSRYKNSSKGIIYNGWPKQKFVYLCSLPNKTFKKTGKIKHQFVSTKAVRPIKIEKLEIKDYLHLIRKATKKEKENWIKKYGKI